MRKELQDILNNPNDIPNHQTTLKIKPTTPQEKFYHAIGHITLLKQKIIVTDFQDLFQNYQGSISCKILSYKFMSYCMENKLIDKYHHFKILSVLSSWIDRLQILKKAEKLRFMYTVAIDLYSRGIQTIQDAIIYLNYIGIDLIAILQESQKRDDISNPNKEYKQQQFVWKNFLDVSDVLVFTSGILPNVLHNIILSNDLFPLSFLPTESPTIDLLYRNQNSQMLAKSKPHYQRLVKTLIKLLLASQTDQIQTKQLVLLTFRYYYIFHFDKTLGANQLVIEALRKMTPCVQFGLSDEILLFLAIIRKLGKDLFINYLANKFDWFPSLIKRISDNPMIGITKNLLNPLPSSELNLTIKFNIARRQIQTRYFQVNHKFSLLFYKIRVLSDDITIRMCYLGSFDSLSLKKQIIITKFKQSEEFKGCIELIEPGIYCFEFDNTYSWVKTKNIILQYTILVPLEIIQQKKKPFLQVLFGNIEQNSVPQNKILKIIDQDAQKQHLFWRNNSNFIRVTWNKAEKLFNVTMNMLNYTYEFETENKKIFKRKFEKLGKLNENNQYLQWWVDRKKFKSWNQALQEMERIQRQLAQNELDEQKQEYQASYQQSSEQNQQIYSQASNLQQQHQYQSDKKIYSQAPNLQQQHKYQPGQKIYRRYYQNSSNKSEQNLSESIGKQNSSEQQQQYHENNFKQCTKAKTLEQEILEVKFQQKNKSLIQQKSTIIQQKLNGDIKDR